MSDEGLPTSAFDYDLPRDRIARYPAERRDESRLLVLERDTGAVRHRRFHDLPELVRPGDILVLNETRVLPARLLGRRSSGAPGEVLLVRPAGSAVPPPAGCGSEGGATNEGGAAGEGHAAGPPLPALWEALVRPGSKLKPGRVLEVADDLAVEVLGSAPGGARVVRLRTPLPVREALARHGRVPLPPYLERADEPLDRERYQTVYARSEGSVAAPTAGLHFTPALLAELAERGVRSARIVLHVGPGTFRPVMEDDPARHRMDAEWYAVDAPVAEAVNRARTDGGAVWAVGTTVVRALETVADEDGRISAASGWTERFIRPGTRFRAVDRLLTNFHLPRSTLLMLVSAFGGHEAVMAAYRSAVAERYRFYSYGDAMAVV